MTSTPNTKPWDLSHVLSLINSLSAEGYSNPTQGRNHPVSTVPSGPTHPSQNLPSDQIEKKDFATSSTSLGDFSKVYQFLGTPPPTPSPASKLDLPTVGESTALPLWEQYASDGAAYIKPHTDYREHGKREPVYSADEAVTDTVSDGSPGPGGPTLTKKQRKKLRKKERKDAQRRQRSQTVSHLGSNMVSESETDTNKSRTPAIKASAHFVKNATATAKTLAEFNHNQSPSPNIQEADSKKTIASMKQAPNKTSNTSTSARNMSFPSNPPQKESVALGKLGPDALTPTQQMTPSVANGGNKELSSMSFLPASLPPKIASRKAPFHQETIDFTHSRPNITNEQESKMTSCSNTPNRSRAIEPIIVRSGEDRNWTLLMKLIGDFWIDRKYLISPMNLTTHNNDPKGIHVFVDASNIFIGFNEQLKRSRRIPSHVHVPAVGLSFDALALLMERRRPVAKRVLVGSMPYMPAFDKAKQVGYECSILEKVYKARELTQRQVYFKELDERASRKRTKVPSANNVALANGFQDANGGYTSGNVSETNAPQFAPARMIEQGVDEILHLKILESVVDAEIPGTMVLATGDAAQAEYSEGFMAMTERALKKGWTVELVSWSANISTMYKKRTWTDAWGEHFRIIMLDDYAEELLDM